MSCGVVFIEAGFSEIVVPAIYGLNTFSKKTGDELQDQMWRFKDKGNRDCCLIPEVTGILQEQFREKWFYEYKKKPLKVFYVSRCYRYEKPQKGRYREFTQFGIEILGGRDRDAYKAESMALLKEALDRLNGLAYEFKPAVKRGLSYYMEDGFEVECPDLGAQKQVAGGGVYEEGVGNWR